MTDSPSDSLFRILDRKPPEGAGTVVLVSDKGKGDGYALTCWHNIDRDYTLARQWAKFPPPGQLKLDQIEVFPRWGDLLGSTGQAVSLVWEWSNPRQDVAVLAISRRIIDEFKLKPTSISFDIHPGDRVVVLGYERPHVGASLARHQGAIPTRTSISTTQEIEELSEPGAPCEQDLFKVLLEVAWTRGACGGAVLHDGTGALVGIPARVVDPPGEPVHRFEMFQGLAVPLEVVGRSWTTIRDWCQVKERRRRDGRRTVLVGALALAMVALLSVGAKLLSQLPSPHPKPPTPTQSAFYEVLYRERPWINYEPEDGDAATREGIRADLQAIAALRVTGIITFRVSGQAAAIAPLARERGLHVIMGIPEPTSTAELDAAIAQARHVDAYCVGHNWLYEHAGQEESLVKAMRRLRRATGKPVSTTVYLKDYEMVVPYVDWLFPDVGHDWPVNHLTAEEMLSKVKQSVEEATRLMERHGKAVLLKMVAYPSDGNGYTTADQRDFYRRLCAEYILRPSLAQHSFVTVSLSVHSAFDLPWKRPMPEPEVHVGLLTRRGPKPAACEVFTMIPFLRSPERPEGEGKGTCVPVTGPAVP